MTSNGQFDERNLLCTRKCLVWSDLTYKMHGGGLFGTGAIVGPSWGYCGKPLFHLFPGTTMVLEDVWE